MKISFEPGVSIFEVLQYRRILQHIHCLLRLKDIKALEQKYTNTYDIAYFKNTRLKQRRYIFIQ